MDQFVVKTKEVSVMYVNICKIRHTGTQILSGTTHRGLHSLVLLHAPPLDMPTSYERRYTFFRGVGWADHDAFIGCHRRAQRQVFHQPARKSRGRSSLGDVLYGNLGPL